MKKTAIGIGVIAFIVVVAIVFLLISLVGGKTAITADEFIEIMEDEGYDVEVETGDDNMFGAVKAAMIGDDEFMVVFCEFESEKDAKNLFKTTTESFEIDELKDEDDVDFKTVETDSYTVYEIVGEGGYAYIARVENTLFYVVGEDDSQDKLEDIVDAIGY